MAVIAKALGDPVRLQLVDVLRRHAGKVCVCELVPLFDLSQPTVSHHLKVLRQAGIVGSERRGVVGLLLRHPRRPDGVHRMAEVNDSRGAGSPPPRVCCGTQAPAALLQAVPEGHLLPARQIDMRLLTQGLGTFGLRMARALFVCLHNAGRSQISEALFSRAAEGRHEARSAGTTPAEHVHPEVVEVMAEVGFDLGGRTPGA